MTKGFQKQFESFMKTKNQEKKLIFEILNYLEKQGFDVHSDDFANAFLVRLGNNEFDSFEHFIEDLEMYRNGEEVGYG